MSKEQRAEEFQERIGYRFQDIGLLRHAWTHSSYTNEQRLARIHNNERLEFLGDAVLELISSDYLYHKYSKQPEGQLTRMRAGMVREESLLISARELRLGDCLIMGRGEERNGGRHKSSILADALEALIGAIYLDGGFSSAQAFVDRFVLQGAEEADADEPAFFDSKSSLQELVQNKDQMERSGLHGKVSYRLLEEIGPDHNKRFVSQVYIGETPLGKGEGRNKKAAEQEAAHRTLESLYRLTQGGR